MDQAITKFLFESHQTPQNGKTWLFSTIDQYNNNKNCYIRIPRKANGETYELTDLNDEQFKIAYVILKKIKEWLSLKSASKDRKKDSSHYE